MIDLSLCIVTYEARDVLEACLRSIFATTGSMSLQVIVVDNNSADGTGEMIKHSYPQVSYVWNDKNLGFQKATNIALRRGTGRYLMWLNNDTLVLNGALEDLVAFADAHPEAGVIGPKVLNRDGTLQKQCRRGEPTVWSAFSYLSGLSKVSPRSKVFSGYTLGHIGEDETHQVEAVSGACLLLRREAMEEVGAIDETFFYGGEDLDYCRRVRQHGWKVLYYPGARIIHLGGHGGSRKRPYKLTYEFHRSMSLYYSRHFSSRYPFFLSWVVHAGIWSHFALAMCRNLLRKDKVPGSVKP